MHITLGGILLVFGAAWLLGRGQLGKGFVRLFILQWILVGAYVLFFAGLLLYALIYDL